MERRVRAALGGAGLGGSGLGGSGLGGSGLSQPGLAEPASPLDRPARGDRLGDFGSAAELLPWLPGDDFAGVVPTTEVPARPQRPPPRHEASRAGTPAGGVDRPRGLRLDPGRRGAAAVAAAAVLAAAVTLVWVLSARPHADAVNATVGAPPAAAAPTPADGSRATNSPSSPQPATLLVVDVAGKVRHPGLYRLPAGSRVDDALRAAGGALPGVGLSSLNLAAKLADGQQIAVGLPGAAAAPGAAPPDASGGPGGVPGQLVNLNSASLEQLEGLPGVGPVLAQHVLDWRAAHGQFATVDQLREVSGIGDVKFAALRPLVTV